MVQDMIVTSTTRQVHQAGICRPEYLLQSTDVCTRCDCSFGRWLYEACSPDCGVTPVARFEEYAFPAAFSILRHAAKQSLMHAILTCEPLCRLKGYTTEQFFFRAGCGAGGYKRHALWIIASPLLVASAGEDSPTIWAKGSLHLIVSASSTGFTRLRLDPPPPFAGEATALVLCYVGDWEAIYESWIAT